MWPASAASPALTEGFMSDQRIAPAAMFDDLIGKPFKDGGRGPAAYDCFGLHKEIKRRLSLPCPEYNICAFAVKSIDGLIEAEAATTWRRLSEPELYALIVIKNDPVFANHVATYMGGGRFLHVMRGINVAYGRINDPEWRLKIKGYYRYAG